MANIQSLKFFKNPKKGINKLLFGEDEEPNDQQQNGTEERDTELLPSQQPEVAEARKAFRLVSKTELKNHFSYVLDLIIPSLIGGSSLEL